MLTRRFNFLLAVLVALVFLSFLTRGYLILDPDFGWHLRLGQIILSAGIPKTDPLSYTMSSFPFVDHEWLTNVLIAKFYPLIGRLGLAGIYAFLAILALFFSLARCSLVKIPVKARTKLILGVWFLGAAAVFSFHGLRPQVISWFFVSLLFLLIFDKRYQRYLFTAPLLFLVWANLHGSFAVGIFFLACFTLFKTFFEKKLAFKELIIFCFSFLVTLINPYHLRLWGEVWQQVSDSSLRWTIEEWYPGIFHFILPFWFLVALIGVCLWRYWRKYSPVEKSFVFLLFFLALTTVRHMPFLVIFTLPLVINGFAIFYQEIKKSFLARKRFSLMSNYFFYLSILILLLTLITALPGILSLRENSYYPIRAISYLQEHPQGGRIFFPYEWGGCLSWRLPEQKVFIDGRMPSWRWQKNLPGESNYIMKEYKGLLLGEIPYNQIFLKYQINTVLWMRPQPEGLLSYWLTCLERFLFPQKTSFDFLSKIIINGWQLVYQDEVAVIYQRPR